MQATSAGQLKLGTSERITPFLLSVRSRRKPKTTCVRRCADQLMATSFAEAGLEVPAERPQPASDPARKKERGGYEDLLQIELLERDWVAHPVVLDHIAARVRD